MSAESQQRGRGSDLEIVSEVTMLEIPRGDEVLRVTFIKARTSQGKDIAWHSIRVFWKDSGGVWRPGKAGVTIRGKELHGVAEAMLRAVASSVPSELHASAKAIVAALDGGNREQQQAPKEREPLPHEVYDRRAGREPR